MIYTERLRLVPIDICYASNIFEIWSDYEVIKYTNIKLMTEISQCEDTMNFLVNEKTDWEYPNNFVVLKGDKAIGLIGFPIIDKESFEFGFYYQIAKEYWWKGYTSEMANAMLNYIFKEYSNATVIATAVVVNIASKKILTKLGFKETHIEKEGFNGLDLIHYKYKKEI
ncbi:MAG: GNAT family N-acetyltransferase [Sarcina sp.]